VAIISRIAIDNTFYPASGGFIHAADNGLIHASLVRQSDGLPYCRIGSDSSHYAEWVLRDAKAPAIDAVDGAAALLYLGPAVDITIEIDGNTVKENIVIYRPVPQRAAVFEVSLTGVDARQNGRNGIDFHSLDDGTLLFTIGNLAASDASGRTAPVAAAWDGEASTITLELADPSWWDDAAYPVIIDPTVSTTTTIDAIAHSQTRGAYYCNGWWWCAANNGTGGVLYKSSDGITWTLDGQIFASATTTLHDTMLSGNTLHVAGAAANTTARYRQITLNADGSTTKGADVSPSPSAAGRVVVGVDSTGMPWMKLKAHDIYVWRNTQTDGQGTWVTFNQNAPSGWSGSYPGDLIAIPDAPGDMLETLWRGNSSGTAEPALASRHWTNATSSWGAWSSIVAVTSYVNGQKQVCTKATSSGAVHTVIITGSTGAIRHYKRSGTAPFDTILISSGITGLTSHARLGIGVNGNTLFIVYDKGDNKLYGREFDGAAWGAEVLIKASANVIQGAIAVSDADGANNHLIVWNEGSASPYSLTSVVWATGGSYTLEIPSASTVQRVHSAEQPSAPFVQYLYTRETPSGPTLQSLFKTGVSASPAKQRVYAVEQAASPIISSIFATGASASSVAVRVFTIETPAQATAMQRLFAVTAAAAPAAQSAYGIETPLSPSVQRVVNQIRRVTFRATSRLGRMALFSSAAPHVIARRSGIARQAMFTSKIDLEG